MNVQAKVKDDNELDIEAPRKTFRNTAFVSRACETWN
jgi:hypothetical protein